MRRSKYHSNVKGIPNGLLYRAHPFSVSNDSIGDSREDQAFGQRSFGPEANAEHSTVGRNGVGYACCIQIGNGCFGNAGTASTSDTVEIFPFLQLNVHGPFVGKPCVWGNLILHFQNGNVFPKLAK